MNRLMIVLGVVVVLLAASCGGGGATVGVPGDGSALNTGVIEGYITEADIARATSAAGNGIGGVEVWCEDPANGERRGQDTTGSDGHYRIGGLPSDTPMLLKFQYRYGYQAGDDNGRVIEGAQQVRLRDREQLRIDAGICPYDDNGDGIPDDVACSNEQLQIQLRERQQGSAGEPGGGQGGSGSGSSGEGSGKAYGSGDGDGNAYGNGDGDGECDGDGNAYGNGNGDGECDGDGNAYGNGDGDCDGDGNAYGNGNGDGDCDGDGNAYGNGNGDGECDGECEGNGDGQCDGRCDGDGDRTRERGGQPGE